MIAEESGVAVVGRSFRKRNHDVPSPILHVEWLDQEVVDECADVSEFNTIVVIYTNDKEEGWPVRICIEVLRKHLTLRDDLARDGWLQDGAETGIDVSHPEVLDEESARSRLAKLGLLTSSTLRIGFQACGTTKH